MMTKVRVNKQVGQIERKVRETCCTQHFLCFVCLSKVTEVLFCVIFNPSHIFHFPALHANKEQRKLAANIVIEEIELRGKWKEKEIK